MRLSGDCLAGNRRAANGPISAIIFGSSSLPRRAPSGCGVAQGRMFGIARSARIHPQVNETGDGRRHWRGAGPRHGTRGAAHSSPGRGGPGPPSICATRRGRPTSPPAPRHAAAILVRTVPAARAGAPVSFLSRWRRGPASARPIRPPAVVFFTVQKRKRQAHPPRFPHLQHASTPAAPHRRAGFPPSRSVSGREARRRIWARHRGHRGPRPPRPFTPEPPRPGWAVRHGPCESPGPGISGPRPGPGWETARPRGSRRGGRGP